MARDYKLKKITRRKHSKPFRGFTRRQEEQLGKNSAARFQKIKIEENHANKIPSIKVSREKENKTFTYAVVNLHSLPNFSH